MDRPSNKLSSGMSESRGKLRQMGNAIWFTACDNGAALL